MNTRKSLSTFSRTDLPSSFFLNSSAAAQPPGVELTGIPCDRLCAGLLWPPAERDLAGVAAPLVLGAHQPRPPQPGARAAQPYCAFTVRLLQNHGRRSGARGREPAPTQGPRPLLVPSHHRRGS
ncbi:UNVERIFIED_CONTAM: hypothetical protein NCL1_34698 [Trichonephila clavipes]